MERFSNPKVMYYIVSYINVICGLKAFRFIHQNSVIRNEITAESHAIPHQQPDQHVHERV